MRTLSFHKSLFTSLLLLLAVLANAQQPTQTIISPQINADNTVTFRLKAATAVSVKIKGTWMKDNEAAVAMIKTDSIWSFTTLALAPDLYRYNFYLEGVEILDPLNSYVERAGTRYESIFITGDNSPYRIKDVPHGTISATWYNSPTLGINRRMIVYTPPGYLENTTKKYPVLYLLHGAGGDEYSWIARGPVGAVLDNLIATGKAKEMIVVVTNGYPGQNASPNAGPVNTNPQAASVVSMGSGRFEESLVKDVIPFIEKRYRVYTDKNNRAIAGFSMGGLQTQHITNSNPDLFAYIAVMSMGLQDNNRLNNFNKEEYGQQVKALVKANPKLYWIGIGKEDFLYSSVVNLRKKYDEAGLKYEYRESEGGHTWSNWSLYLSEVVPKLFK